MIRETMARFANDRIAPLAARIDQQDWSPRDLCPAIGVPGQHGFAVEEKRARCDTAPFFVVTTL